MKLIRKCSLKNTTYYYYIGISLKSHIGLYHLLISNILLHKLELLRLYYNL